MIIIIEKPCGLGRQTLNQICLAQRYSYTQTYVGQALVTLLVAQHEEV